MEATTKAVGEFFVLRDGTTPTALIQKWKQPPKRLGSFLCFAKMSKWTMNLELQDGSYGSRHENAPLR